MTVHNKLVESYCAGNWDIYLGTYGVEVSMNGETTHGLSEAKSFDLSLALGLNLNDKIGASVFLSLGSHFVTNQNYLDIFTTSAIKLCTYNNNNNKMRFIVNMKYL